MDHTVILISLIKKLRLRKNNSQGHRQVVEIRCVQVCFQCLSFLFPATLPSPRCGEWMWQTWGNVRRGQCGEWTGKER